MSDKNPLRSFLTKLGIDPSITKDVKAYAEESSDDSDSENELEIVDIRAAMKDAEQTAGKNLSRALKKFDLVFQFFASTNTSEASASLFKKRIEDSLIFLNTIARVTTQKPASDKEKFAGYHLLCMSLTFLENSFFLFIAEDPEHYKGKMAFDDPVTLAKIRQQLYQNYVLYAGEEAKMKYNASIHFTKAMSAFYEAKSPPVALEHLRNSLSLAPSPICQRIYDKLKPATITTKPTRNQRRRKQAKGGSQLGIQSALKAAADTEEETKRAAAETKNIIAPENYTPNELNQWMKKVFIPECKNSSPATQEQLLKILDDLFPVFKDPDLFKKYLKNLLPLLNTNQDVDSLSMLYQLMILAALFSLKSNVRILYEKPDKPSKELLTAIDMIIYDQVPYSDAWVAYFLSITPEATATSLKQALAQFISVHKPDKSLGYGGAMAATLCSLSAVKIESIPVAPVASIKAI